MSSFHSYANFTCIVLCIVACFSVLFSSMNFICVFMFIVTCLYILLERWPYLYSNPTRICFAPWLGYLCKQCSYSACKSFVTGGFGQILLKCVQIYVHVSARERAPSYTLWRDALNISGCLGPHATLVFFPWLLCTKNVWRTCQVFLIKISECPVVIHSHSQAEDFVCIVLNCK